MTIDEYLEMVGKNVGNEYGRSFRRDFSDNRGTAELAMLASPSVEEYEQLKRAVAIMTSEEKNDAARLNDEQVHRIADDAGIDRADFAIFINGYGIHEKRVRQQRNCPSRN